MRIVIRADAGPAIGTGHVMRMMALGQALVQMDAEVSLLSGTLPVGLVQRLESVGIEYVRLKNSESGIGDADETSKFARTARADWVVLDGYRLDAKYQGRLAVDEAQIMMMDDGDLADASLVDMIVNQNAYANCDSQGGIAKRLNGCRYTLLRSEFLSAEACEPKVIRQQARRILLTFGGCDIGNWTRRTLEALGGCGSDRLIVDVVLGAGYRELESLLNVKRSLPFSVRVHRNVDRMVDLMHRVDLAITAGGSTCYELARCGIPAIAIPVANNQMPVVDALARRGVVVAFDPGQPDGHEALRLTVSKLVKDQGLRSRMSRNGTELVDGHGALRIARLMATSGVELRDAVLSDGPQLLDWRNDPEVRSVSFSTEAVSYSNHMAWLERKLEDANSRILIAEDRNGVPVGQIRLDFQSNQQAIISVSVDHTRRARGLGKVLIEQACELVFDEYPALQSVLAQIKPGNVASERAFRNVGFSQIEPAMIGKKLAFQFVLQRDAIEVARRSVA